RDLRRIDGETGRVRAPGQRERGNQDGGEQGYACHDSCRLHQLVAGNRVLRAGAASCPGAGGGGGGGAAACSSGGNGLNSFSCAPETAQLVSSPSIVIFDWSTNGPCLPSGASAAIVT